MRHLSFRVVNGAHGQEVLELRAVLAVVRGDAPDGLFVFEESLDGLV